MYVDYPHIHGTAEEKIEQISNYLFKLAEVSNYNLDQSTPEGIFRQAAEAVTSAESEAIEEGQRAKFGSLRDLIIKSAGSVKISQEEISHSLAGLFVATSDFGTFKKETEQNFSANSGSFKSLFKKNEEISTDLTNYKTEMQNYIFAGYDGDTFALDVGLLKDTYTADGKTTENGTPKKIRITPSRLSLFSGDYEAAYLSENAIYFPNANITGGTLNIGGGRFAVDSEGTLSATGAKISGDITATSGSFSGELKAATGTFSGSLSAAKGTFAGSLSAAKGTFAGNLSAAGGTFSGELKAATGTFSGSLSAAKGTFAGNLSAAGGTFSGELKAATGTFSGSLSAAKGTFAGNLSAAGGTFSGELKAATGTFAGNLSAAGGTFAGNLSAAGGSFSGELKAATGTFVGDISAATGTFSGGIQATTGSVGGLTISSGSITGGNLTITASGQTYDTGIRIPVINTPLKMYDVHINIDDKTIIGSNAIRTPVLWATNGIMANEFIVSDSIITNSLNAAGDTLKLTVTYNGEEVDGISILPATANNKTQIYTQIRTLVGCTSTAPGNVYANGLGSLFRNTSSSRRYKTDISELKSERLNPHGLYKVPVVEYVYKKNYLSSEDLNYGKKVIGLIAEDVEKYYPIGASYNEDGTIENWNERFVIPGMLKLIQEQHKQITKLQAQVSVLIAKSA